MTKIVRRFALMLCTLVLCMSFMSIVCFAAEEVTAQIPVRITLDGTLPKREETFVLELTPADASYPMPDGSENGVYRMELKGEDSDTIWIRYSKVGAYEYTVKQIAGTNTNCTYDSSIYRVTVFVTNAEGGGFDVSVVVYRGNDTDKDDDIVFKNVYANPDSVTITAIKTLDGRTPKDGRFTFQLLDAEGNVVAEAQNDGRTVTFPKLSFYEKGTFSYTLKEVKGKDRGIQYDQTEYDVTIVVTKRGDYHAKLFYEKDGEAYEGTPIFANKTVISVLPYTGDDSGIAFFTGLMVVSGVAIIVLLVVKKRKKEED